MWINSQLLNIIRKSVNQMLSGTFYKFCKATKKGGRLVRVVTVTRLFSHKMDKFNTIIKWPRHSLTILLKPGESRSFFFCFKFLLTKLTFSFLSGQMVKTRRTERERERKKSTLLVNYIKHISSIQT